MSAAALNEMAVLVTALAKPIGAVLFATELAKPIGAVLSATLPKTTGAQISVTELAKPIGTVFPADDEVAKGLTFESSSES